jgi:hypothetical protein
VLLRRVVMPLATALETFISLQEGAANGKSVAAPPPPDGQKKRVKKRGRPPLLSSAAEHTTTREASRVKKRATYRVAKAASAAARRASEEHEESSSSSSSSSSMDLDEDDVEEKAVFKPQLKSNGLRMKGPSKEKQRQMLLMMRQASKASSSKEQQTMEKPKKPAMCMGDFFQARPINIGSDGLEAPKLVARYGRIYKRKAPDRVREKDCGQLKTAPGMRLCRMCKCLQPLDKFYSNVKRFVCKKHHYERVLLRKEIRFKACSFEKLAYDAWRALFKICPLLGYAHVNYDRHDIMDLLMKTHIPPRCKPRVLPIDPRAPLRPRNVAIVTEATFKLAKQLLKCTLSTAQFILLVQSCNLLPENADAGKPWAPFENPAYRRVDMDVVPILQAENAQSKKERPLLDAIQYARENAAERHSKPVEDKQQQQPSSKEVAPLSPRSYRRRKGKTTTTTTTSKRALAVQEANNKKEASRLRRLTIVPLLKHSEREELMMMQGDAASGG